ncbi:MAG TPA: peptidylprolyl isomerase [Ferruginibacter sp.]|nr:peptidylprolyl isomerase [Ferruginibacter sp.]
MNKLKTLLALVFLCFFVTNIQAQVKKPAVKKTVTHKATTAKPGTAKSSKSAAQAPKLVKVAGTRVKITTDSGVIIIRLYDKTPLHRDNFIKLVKDHFYDSLLFHRVIQAFMIQGGDPESKHAQPGQQLGSGDVGYTIPAEFDTTLFHKKGALAAARQSDQVNPLKASSGCQFYIVQGKKWTDQDLDMIGMQTGIKFSPAKREIYKTLGGTPFLDMNYTVFGEVESGLDVVDKIASVPKAPGDRPIGDVHMYMELIK